MTRATRSVLSHGSSRHSQFADEKTEAPGSKANFPSREEWGGGGGRAASTCFQGQPGLARAGGQDGEGGAGQAAGAGTPL